MGRPCWLWSALLILGCSLQAGFGHEHAVIPLHTDNFEHATQAASGQTTGFWFVYFGKEDAGADQQMWRTFAEHQREEQPWLLHAFVDVDSNPELAQRFDIKTTHAFILFRNSKMYRFQTDYVSRLEPALMDALASFATSGWRNAQAERVPPDRHSRSYFSATGTWLVVGAAALLAVLAALLGQQFKSYFDAATPPAARHTKGQ